MKPFPNLLLPAYLRCFITTRLFSATATTVAQRLGLKGYVKNLRDGGVELSAQGSFESIQEMKKWCEQGPPMASVTEVQQTSPLTIIPSTTYNDFAIRH